MFMNKFSAFVLCFLLGGISSKGIDQCHQHERCSPCVNARYTTQEKKNWLGGYRYEKEESSRQHLRRKEHWEEYLQHWDQLPQNWYGCVWCKVGNKCQSENSSTKCPHVMEVAGGKNVTTLEPDHEIFYGSECPLEPNYPAQPPLFLPHWMGTLLHISGSDFGNRTLSDISLPGTHDSLSYDLSLVISDEGLGSSSALSGVLHALSSIHESIVYRNGIREFLRLQAKSQQLNIIQQLDNGIRFIDFRIMMDKHSKRWYTVHFMRSKHVIGYYFHQIRTWMDAHPEEIVVIFLSHRGATSLTGNLQYPTVFPREKQSIWQSIVEIFDGVLLDSRLSRVNETTVSDLVQRNHRLVMYVADYEEFTGASPLALDGALIDNSASGESQYSSSVFDEPSTMKSHIRYFQNARRNNREAKSRAGFTLMGMNTQGEAWQIIGAAKMRFLPKESAVMDEGAGCARKTRIPGIQRWCPETLLDLAQLTSYYDQIVLDGVLRLALSGGKGSDIAMPNAIYIDALDVEGTIRTGIKVLSGAERGLSSQQETSNEIARFAYVHTILMFNLNLSCDEDFRHISSLYNQIANNSDNFTKGASNQSACLQSMLQLQGQREKYPLTLWDDPELGRHKNWPDVNFEGFLNELVVAMDSANRNNSEAVPANPSLIETTHALKFKYNWWGLIPPQFSFLSMFAFFGPTYLRYAASRFARYVLNW